MKEPLFGAFEEADPSEHHLGPIQRVPTAMRHFDHDEAVDFVVVGVGSAGGVLIQRLAKAGFSVIGFDAGPFWDTERDWVSDEAGSHKLYWEDLRVIGGKNPLALGANNSGKGVGGGSVHWAGFTPRLHPSDFRVLSEDGIGADWPFTYDELRPYYELMEREIPVAGPPYFPWGEPHGYTYAAHPVGAVSETLVRGCTRLGIPVVAGGPVAINSGSHGSRPHCIYRGFCIQGCKVGAKQSTLVSHVPDAIRHGAEVRDRCMVGRIEMGKDGRVTGVTYFDPDGHEQRQRARAVIVSGYAIETPRLLFNSACPGFEQGLSNSSGTLGKYLMAQIGNTVYGRFDELIRMYKAPPANGLTEEFYETDPHNDFVRGFALQTIGPLPISFAQHIMVAKGAWGWSMRRVLMDYNHWSPLGVLGEILPWEDNAVTLDDARDHYGLRVAHVTFNLHENDHKIADAGVRKAEEILRAAGATEVVNDPRYAHLVGGARMGASPRDSVVDGFGRSWDIPNLFVCDGSLMPTQGSANPGLTIQALAARTADYLVTERENAVAARPPAHVTIHYDLSPAEVAGRGMPRMKTRRPLRLGAGALGPGSRG